MSRLLKLKDVVVAGAILLLLSGCAFQATLDKMVSRDRQSAIIADARLLCDDVSALRPDFDRQLWTETEPQFPRLAAECPADPATFVLTTYRFNTNTSTGGAGVTHEQAVIVAGPTKLSTATGPWSEFALNYVSEGDDPPRIVGWYVRKTAANQHRCNLSKTGTRR